MKRFYSLIITAVTLLCAVSCVQELSNTAENPEGAVVYKAIAEAAVSRAVLGTNESGRPQSMWEDGDKIYIATGDGMSYLFSTSLESPSPVAHFTTRSSVDLSEVSAVIASYPANLLWGDPLYLSQLSIIPTVQYVRYDMESYDRNAVPAIAYSKNRTLNFNNVSSLLKFKVNQDGVSKIRFSALSGEYIAGGIIVMFDEDGSLSFIGPDNSMVQEPQTHYVELLTQSGEDFTTDRTYYLSLIPGTLERGFIIEMFDANDSLVYAKEYDRSITIKRNVILNLGTLGNGNQEETVDKMFVVGSYNGWRHDKNLYLFGNPETPNIYSGIVDFNAYAHWDASHNEFKLTGGAFGDDEFSQASGEQYGNEADVLSLVEGSGSNINAYQTYRFYHFTLDKSNSTLTKNYAFNSISVTGDFNAWSKDLEMNYNPDTQKFWVDLDLSEDTELRVRFDHEWNYLSRSGDDSGYFDDTENIFIAAGQYRFYVDMNKMDDTSSMAYFLAPEVYGTEENAGQWDPWADEPEPSSPDYIDEYGINHGPGVEINGVVWAPVNCGYHAENFKYGKFYQWGRKYGQGYNGYNYPDAIMPTLKTGPVLLAEGQAFENENVFFNIENVAMVQDEDRYWSAGVQSGLWNFGTEQNPIKTEYDPCPEGWRVPTSIEASSLESATYSWFDSSNTDYNGVIGTLVTDALGSVNLFFPAGGYVACGDGSGVNRGAGFYWSSDYSDTYRAADAFIITGGYYTHTDPSAFGMAVRCVKEETPLVEVDNVIIDKTSLSMDRGQVYRLSAAVTPSNANQSNALWYSDTPSVATVDKDGTITAVSAGTAKIIAMAGMKVAECVVTVTDNLAFVGTWKGSVIGSRRNYEVTFNISVPEGDATSTNVVISAGINPYFILNGIDQVTYMGEVQGNQLIVHAGQSAGYGDTILVGFNHADPTKASQYDDIRFILNEDGTLTQPYAYAVYSVSAGGYYEYYNGEVTYTKENEEDKPGNGGAFGGDIEDMPEIELF